MKRARRVSRSVGQSEAKPNTTIASIKVVGVGGGGGNAVSRMARDFVRGVDFIAINTDQQDLDQCNVRRKIYIGRNLTRGLGTGMNPDLGRQAAEENRSEIAEALRGADLVFIAAGMGGGTGTGASPVVAETSKQSGALTIAVVTRPFAFEGTQREKIAHEGVAKLREKVDAIIVVPNDRIFSIISKETPIMKAFAAIDEVLRNALKGIVELIVTPGIINVDFADVRAIIQDAGSAIVGVGIASGQDRSVQAVSQALNSPLLEVSAEGAHGVLLGISGSRDLRMTEINEAAKLVAQTVDPSARIIFGAYFDRNLKPNQVKVTLIATGFSNSGFSQNNSLFNGYTFESKQSFSPDVKPEVSVFKDRDERRPVSFEEKASTNAFFQSNDFAASLLREEEEASTQEPVLKSQPQQSQPPVHRQNGQGEQKKRESDIWDIPTFLRKKKR